MSSQQKGPHAHPHNKVSTRPLNQGSDLFFQAALQYGYRYVFGNPGTTEAPFMDGLVRYPELQFQIFLQEDGASGAADGLARMTGWPAIINLHLGPGLANALSNIHNARRAQVPMLVTVGDHHSRHLIEDSALASDIEGLARTACKWTWTVKEAGELADALYRATLIAMEQPQGPVCLILPSNILTAPPRTVDGNIPTIPDLHIPRMGPANTQDIEQAVALLQTARQPTILVGDIEAEDYTSIVQLASIIGARVACDPAPRRLDGSALPGSVWVPYFPEERRAFFAQADLLLLVRVNSFASLFLYENNAAPTLNPGTKVIHLTDDINALGKNERGSYPLYGDVSATLISIITHPALAQKGMNSRDPNTGPLLINDQPPPVNPAATGPIQAPELMQAVRQYLPPNTILVDEAITARQTMLDHLLDKETPVTTLLGVRGSAIGGGLPVALGAQIGAPERPTVAIIGDGSAMYTIQVLWTAAHYHSPILVIICNNASYDIIKLELLRLRGTLAGESAGTLDAVAGLGNPRLDFAQIANGMGVQGWVIQEREELVPVLEMAFKTIASGQPALIDIHLASPFAVQS